MGKIWLQTSTGFRIHLPIIGSDLNAPDTAIPVSGIALATQNRNLDGQIQVVHPTYGIIVFDFSATGRTGTCNQCGQCCSHPVVNCPNPPNCGSSVNGYTTITNNKVDYHACPYLTIFPGASKGIGKVNGTECSLRSSIIDQVKGCTLFPQKVSEIEVWMIACGFSFEV